MNDIGLRELVAKWRLLGDDMVTSDICSRAHFVRLHQCATELESILAAPQDQPIDADDNAGYIEHCADILDKYGYRISGTTLRAIASVHRDLTTKAPQAAPAWCWCRWS